MLLDEWHLEVTAPPGVTLAEVEAIASIVDTLIEPFAERLEATLRSSTGIAGLEVVVSQ